MKQSYFYWKEIVVASVGSLKLLCLFVFLFLSIAEARSSINSIEDRIQSDTTMTKCVERDGFVWYKTYNQETGKYGVNGEEGKSILSSEFDFICYQYSGNGWFCVVKNDKYGAYAKDGKQICEPIYDNLSFSKDGNSVFCIFKKDGKTGAMNVQGKVIVQPNSLYNKMLFYAKDGFNYLDHSGKFVPIGIDVNGNALVNKQKIGKPSKKNKENSMERVVVFYPYSSCLITDAKGSNSKNNMKPQGSFSAEIEFLKDSVNAYFYDVTKETKNILLGFVFDLKTSEFSINKEEKRFCISDAETKIIVSEAKSTVAFVDKINDKSYILNYVDNPLGALSFMLTGVIEYGPDDFESKLDVCIKKLSQLLEQRQ